MYINATTTLPAARQPRGIVKINGAVMPGWTEFEVDNNAFYHADTFRCRFAISALPADYGAAWWASQSTIHIELFAGFPADVEKFSASDLKKYIYGRVDEVTYDPVGTFIEVSGRDLTADFIDTKTYEQFVNHTSSEIAVELASRHSLTAVVMHTTTKAGTYYTAETRRIPLDRSEWDLLTWLAQEEGCSVYVKDQQLFFDQIVKPDASRYALRWEQPTPESGLASPTFNGVDIVCSRNLTLANDIIVYVRSSNSRNPKGFTVKAQASHTKKAISKGATQPAGAAQIYSFVVAGKSHLQAQTMANKKLAELSFHERRISVTLPADDLLQPSTLVSLSGTGTDFDQTYYPDSITRRLSFAGGYTMHLSAKNHSPESTVLA
jgi:phage protein D